MAETAQFCISAGKGGGSAAHRGHVVVAGRVHDALVFAAGAVAAVLVLLGTSSFLAPAPVPNIVASRNVRSFAASSHSSPSSSSSAAVDDYGAGANDKARTFYDDPGLSYAVGKPVTGWDAKRAEWLRLRRPRAPVNATAAAGGRVVMLTGSQAAPCAGAGGDHLMLRFLKNKVDYCRLHGIELLYNTALLQPEMRAYWAKIPSVRAAMLAHPDAEWVFWVDADAVFTDMDFSLPLDKYRDKNLVLYGWPREVYGAKSWVGLNAGVFLIRNCQWSLDFMDAWARMGPASPEYARWGNVLRDELEGKPDNESDDQSALVYLLAKNQDKWGTKTYLESKYYFQGYWVEIVRRLDGIAAKHEAVERRVSAAAGLRRRHAEGEHLRYAAARNRAVRNAVLGPAGGGQTGWRRPFVTHFTGCQPCGGKPNKIYSKKSCADGMRRALNFADDQVLRAYGFRHAGPLSDDVRPLPFNYPAAAR